MPDTLAKRHVEYTPHLQFILVRLAVSAHVKMHSAQKVAKEKTMPACAKGLLIWINRVADP